MIEFIHISDTHFGPTEDLDIRGAIPFDRNVFLVEQINALPFDVDFIVHTGDIVNDPDFGAYRLAERVLSRLKAPIHYVSGNHDDTNSIKKLMNGAPHDPLPGIVDKQAYSFSMGQGVTGVMFDAWVPETEGPHGFLPLDQLAAFEGLLQGTEDKFALFLHYPMIPVGAKWLDEYLLVKNGEQVHQFLRHYRDRLCGVFFGHLHRGLQMYRDGVLYSGVSSPLCSFSASPLEHTCQFNPNCAAPFNHVSISSHGTTMVKEYSIPFPRAFSG